MGGLQDPLVDRLPAVCNGCIQNPSQVMAGVLHQTRTQIRTSTEQAWLCMKTWLLHQISIHISTKTCVVLCTQHGGWPHPMLQGDYLNVLSALCLVQKLQPNPLPVAAELTALRQRGSLTNVRLWSFLPNVFT